MTKEQLEILDKYDQVGNYSDISKYEYGKYVRVDDLKIIIEQDEKKEQKYRNIISNKLDEAVKKIIESLN